MGWVRKHPELVILAAFVLAVTIAIVRAQARNRAPAHVDVADSPAPGPVQTTDPAGANYSYPPPSTIPPPANVVTDTSVTSAPAAAPSAAVTDNPTFDLTGSGDACRMHYFQDSQGETVTLFYLAADGELITHVSGPDGIGRHDEQMTRGVNRIVYDFPLSEATDMGAVLFLSDGSSQSCTISAGSDIP